MCVGGGVQTQGTLPRGRGHTQGTLTPEADRSSWGWSGTTKMRLTNLQHRVAQ